jgi:hypothetical protein
MDPVPVIGNDGQQVLTATGEPLYEQPPAPPPPNPEDVERVKGKWGEELNTAFQYEKYVGERAESGNWASSAPRYEWQDDVGADDIAPRDEKLERQLFGDENEGNMGINFDKYVLLSAHLHPTPFPRRICLCDFLALCQMADLGMIKSM